MSSRTYNIGSFFSVRYFRRLVFCNSSGNGFRQVSVKCVVRHRFHFEFARFRRYRYCHWAPPYWVSGSRLVYPLYIFAAVRSVTLNLANKFSQCTFSVAEHYDLFSDLIIIRPASWRRSYDVIPHRPHRTDRQAQRYHTDLKLIYMLPIMHTRLDDNLESTATSNQSGTTDAVFTKLPRSLAKDRKNTLANSRPI